MSMKDEILGHLDEFGPDDANRMGKALGYTTRQITNALAELSAQGRVHNCGPAPRVAVIGRTPSMFRLGWAPGWLPSPLPVNSVWDWASRLTKDCRIPRGVTVGDIA